MEPKPHRLDIQTNKSTLSTMSNRLTIIGTGGNALDVFDIVDSKNVNARTWEVVGFLDDSKQAGSQHMGLPILGSLSSASQNKNCVFINTIGSDVNYRYRSKIIAGCGLENHQFSTLVHNNSSISIRAKLGVGVCVNYGVSIGGGATIGDHVYIGAGAIIGHDAVIGPFSIIAPGAIISGFVDIGTSCYIGAGSTIRQRLCVGDFSLIGMGAVVTRNVKASVTVVGNPAKILSKNETEEK